MKLTLRPSRREEVRKNGKQEKALGNEPCLPILMEGRRYDFQ